MTSYMRGLMRQTLHFATVREREVREREVRDCLVGEKRKTGDATTCTID